jgi:hypothetical protein
MDNEIKEGKKTNSTHPKKPRRNELRTNVRDYTMDDCRWCNTQSPTDGRNTLHKMLCSDEKQSSLNGQETLKYERRKTYSSVATN